MPTSDPDLSFGTIFAGAVLARRTIVAFGQTGRGRRHQHVDGCRIALSDPAARLAIPMLRDLSSHFFRS